MYTLITMLDMPLHVRAGTVSVITARLQAASDKNVCQPGQAHKTAFLCSPHLCVPCCRAPVQLSRVKSLLTFCKVHGHRRGTVHVLARGPRYDDDYVEFDEEESWSKQARRQASLVPSLAGPVLLAANSVGNKLADIACDFVPSTVDRGTVEIAVKAALVLVVVSIAKSLLGVALTVGTVVFGIYVATKIWSKQDPQGAAGSNNRSSMQSTKRRQSRKQDDDGLSDVWFESKPKRKTSRESQNDSFW